MVNDPISDMLTRIRNSLTGGKTQVVMPHSKMKEAIAKILKDQNFVDGYEVTGEGVAKMLAVKLITEMEMSPITALERVSKPGRRVYSPADKIPKVLGGRGIVIVSTSKGLMTDFQARKAGLGGELICKVW
jgi:small subunit ribosomal protein S8